MTIHKIICDRCGKEFEDRLNKKDLTAKINYWGPGARRSGVAQQIDLCCKCNEEFINFMEEHQ